MLTRRPGARFRYLYILLLLDIKVSDIMAQICCIMHMSSLVCYFRVQCSTTGFPSQWFYSQFGHGELISLWATLEFCSATAAFIVTFSDRPPPRVVLLPPPPRPPLPPRAPPRPRPGRPRSPKLISSWEVMSLASLRKWWSPDSSLVC